MFTEIEDIKKLDIRSMMFDELAVWVKAVGQPAFRAKQIFEWVHEKGIADAEEMTNVPKKLIEEIKKQGMHGVEEVTRLVSCNSIRVCLNDRIKRWFILIFYKTLYHITG